MKRLTSPPFRDANGVELYQPRATPWVKTPKTFASAEGAIHTPDDAGRWPATESNSARSQGVALGWYESGLRPEERCGLPNY